MFSDAATVTAVVVVSSVDMNSTRVLGIYSRNASRIAASGLQHSA